jgi:hypothetical protein
MHSMILGYEREQALPYIHAVMAFVDHTTFYLDQMDKVLGPAFPQELCAVLLNALLQEPTMQGSNTLKRIKGDAFPEIMGDSYATLEAEIAALGTRRRNPLPEDYAMRGLLWTDKYLPEELFFEEIADEDKYCELASMTPQRWDRILHLAYQISRRHNGQHLYFDGHAFHANLDEDWTCQ